MNIKQKKRAKNVLKRWENRFIFDKSYKKYFRYINRKIIVRQTQYEHKCNYALRRKYGKIN